MSSIRSAAARAIDPILDLPARSSSEDDAAYEVWTVVDHPDGRPRASVDSADRERLLVEAGRLYGRDHARARAALADGTHPLCRLKRPAG